MVLGPTPRGKRSAIPDRIDRDSLEMGGDVRRAGAKRLGDQQDRQDLGAAAHCRRAAGQLVADLERILAGLRELSELVVLVRAPAPHDPHLPLTAWIPTSNRWIRRRRRFAIDFRHLLR